MSAGRRPWTLRSRLVIGIAVLVGVVLLVVGVIGGFAMRASLANVVNDQLTAGVTALEHSVHKYRNGGPRGGEPDPTAGDGKGFDKPLVDFVGHAPNTLIAIVKDGEILDSARFSDAGGAPIKTEVREQLEQLTERGPGRYDIELAGLGAMRVAVHAGEPGELLLAGVSLEAVNNALLQEGIATGILAALGLIATVIGTIIVVRLALRPVERVVNVAEAVSILTLDKGDTGIPIRVDAGDTDARTEVGKVGAALNSLLEHVEEALAVRAETDRRMRRFVTDASHELRTPLAAIQGYAELTRQESALLPATTEYSLARIESEAKRMNSLVSELLLLARLDEGQDLQIEEVDLSDVVATAVNDARATEPGHHWVAEVPVGPVFILGDRERLHQLVVNVLSNAALHAPDGTVVTARLSVEAGNRVELRIDDTGPGISAELLPVLFERFVRGDKARSRAAGSTGLGLSIAQSIAEAHGGTIEVASSPSGATFTIAFATS